MEVQPNRVLPKYDVMSLVDGTPIWVEYHPKRFAKDSEPMIRKTVEDGWISYGAIGNNTGYLPLNEGHYFGKTYRVWLRRPTVEESSGVPWN